MVTCVLISVIAISRRSGIFATAPVSSVATRALSVKCGHVGKLVCVCAHHGKNLESSTSTKWKKRLPLAIISLALGYIDVRKPRGLCSAFHHWWQTQ